MFISPLDLKSYVIMSTIKENKKKSVTPLPFNSEYSDATQAANMNPQVVYDEPYNPWINDIISQFGLPEEGLFNPYDYISHKNYKMNRRGQASYEEDLARLTYLADLRQQEFQNEYNSPENQAKLLREAGINPDLQGVSASGSASGPTPSGSAMANQPTNMQMATNVLGIISNVANLTTSMLQGGLGISNAFKQAASTDISIMGNAMDFFSKYYSQGFDVENLPLSRRARRRMRNVYETTNSFWWTIQENKRNTSVNKSWSDFFQSNFDRWSKEFNKYFSASDHDADGMLTTDDWAEVWSPLAKFAENILLNEYELKDKTTKNNLDYQNTTFNGQSLGSMHGASDTETYNQVSFSSAIREPLREVVGKLKKKADEGSTWANFALIALFLVTQISGTFGRSSSPKGSSSSFSIGI